MKINKRWPHYIRNTWPPRFLLALALALFVRLGQQVVFGRPFEIEEFFNLPVCAVLGLAVLAMLTDPVVPEGIKGPVERP